MLTFDQLETIEAAAVAWIAALDLILDVWPADEGTQIEREAAVIKREWTRTEMRNRQSQQQALEF
jgi:hypothetical protein